MFENSLHMYYTLFYMLEDSGAMDVANELHLLALCYVYMFQGSIILCPPLGWLGIVMASQHHIAIVHCNCGTLEMLSRVGRHNYPAVQEIFATSEDDSDSSSPLSGSEHSSSLPHSNLTLSTHWPTVICGVLMYMQRQSEFF